MYSTIMSRSTRMYTIGGKSVLKRNFFLVFEEKSAKHAGDLHKNILTFIFSVLLHHTSKSGDVRGVGDHHWRLQRDESYHGHNC